MSAIHASATESTRDISDCLDDTVHLRQFGTGLLARLPDELYWLGYSDREIGAILLDAVENKTVAALAGALGCAADDIGVDAEHDLMLRDVVEEVLAGQY
jgi:hypothetical protein